MYDALKARLAERGLTIDAAKVANRTDLIEKLQLALDANKTFLAITSPTNAQNAAQVKQLTRQMNRLIRVVANLTDQTE